MRAVKIGPPSATLPSLNPASAAPDFLFRALLHLALPIVAENLLSVIVGLNDAYLANHLPASIRVDGTAAVGTAVYIFWFSGLVAGALGTGATAIIARAIGARHRARAHACCGQALLFAAAAGIILGLIFLIAAPFVASIGGLTGQAHVLFTTFIRTFSFGAPSLIVLFVANACLRGAGDTRSPLYAMIVVNTVNVALTWLLTFGYGSLPPMGIRGIALGTAIAYTLGAIIQITNLLRGSGGLKLRFHRLRFHRVEMKRLLKIGLPSAGESALMWTVNFFLIHIINGLGTTNAAAHLNAVRIEGISFMPGFAVAVAVSTLVGQSLGRKDPARATRVAYYGYAMAGISMTLMGLIFICLGHRMADIMSEDITVRDLTASCLFITGFVQFAFAAFIVFSAALRGAGDTRSVLLLNLLSVGAGRLIGVYIAGYVFHASLPVIWIVLCSELLLRGTLAFLRFRHGGWKTIKV